MAHGAIAVLTGKSVETLLKDGGSGSWLLNTKNARRQHYLVCARNTRREEAGSSEPHGSAFLVGTISGLIPLPPENNGERWRIAISQYAVVDIPDAWRGWRNPVRYTTLEEMGVDLKQLMFLPVPTPVEGVERPLPVPTKSVRGLTIPEAKAGLAATLGISPDAIEIIIKG